MTGQTALVLSALIVAEDILSKLHAFGVVRQIEEKAAGAQPNMSLGALVEGSLDSLSTRKARSGIALPHLHWRVSFLPDSPAIVLHIVSDDSVQACRVLSVQAVDTPAALNGELSGHHLGPSRWIGRD